VLPARWAPLFRDAAGLAFDPDTRRLFVSDALAGQISVIQLDVDGDGIDDTPLAWVRHQLAVVHELVSPRGLSVDHVDGKVLVADAGAHCVLSVDPTSGDADVVLGACGVFGRDNDTAAQERSLLFAPAAAVRSPSGALYVSDAGNRRVRRAEAGIVTTVIGEGSASTAGEGRPARTFPIEDPGQLVVDAHGNLFIAAGSAVRLVANIDGDADADGDDLALTPFAGRGNDTFPDRLFRCVTGLADTGDGVIVSDSCTGLVVNVR
jgi:DNA-binding beta-propeller fold protein YncE